MASAMPIMAFRDKLSTLRQPPETPEAAYKQLNEVYGVGGYTIKFCDMTPIVTQTASPGADGKIAALFGLSGYVVGAELQVSILGGAAGVIDEVVARVYGDAGEAEGAQEQAVTLLVRHLWDRGGKGGRK